MKRIVLTGGGTAGHVTPNIALLPRLKELGYDIHYIGSYNGMEKKLIEDCDIPYYGISSGKLRRYFDVKNFSDPFKVLKGYGQARKLLKKLKPDVEDLSPFLLFLPQSTATFLQLFTNQTLPQDLPTNWLFQTPIKFVVTSRKP